MGLGKFEQLAQVRITGRPWSQDSKSGLSHCKAYAFFPIPHNASSETLKGREQTDGKAITKVNLGLKGRMKIQTFC